jgi:hypothetical protein
VKKADQYRPKRNNETLGAYLKRLRLAASEEQGKTISQDMVAELAAHLPAPQKFTGAWLSVAESDGYKHAGGDKLRTLANIYSKLLRTTIPAEWLLSKAGFEVEQAAIPAPDSEVLDRLLQQEDVLALIGIIGQLIEMGYEDDVRLLVTLAQRYLSARNPKAKAGDIFDDATVSQHVERYMEALGLV